MLGAVVTQRDRMSGPAHVGEQVRMLGDGRADGGRHGGEDPVLVLTRRANQSIMIGHEIVVTVLEVRGDQVRLGIKAPRSIDVHREEIFAQLQQANRDAAKPPKHALDSLRDLKPRTDEREPR